MASNEIMTPTSETDGWTCDEATAAAAPDVLAVAQDGRSPLERFSDAYQSIHWR